MEKIPNNKIVSGLKRAVDERLTKNEKELFQLSSVLDPQFKFQWCQLREHDMLIEKLKLKYCTLHVIHFK